MAERNLKNLFGLIAKSVPAIDQITEVTREGIPKAFIPYFFYKPPFGYPRYTDLVTIRRLASTPYVEMCINLILDEMSSIEFDIVTEDGIELTPQKQSEIDHVKSFFDNPNTNKESFPEIREQYLRDVLEINCGVINKMFNMKEEMVEIVARDGATFTKNPDIYGMYTDREDIIRESNIAIGKKEESLVFQTPGMISSADVREKAAYFQYGWSTAARPVPFGKKELVFFERRKRTDNLYARSMVEVLANTIQTFIYAIENDLEFFSDNQIPRGVIGLEGSNSEEIKAFRDQWKEQQREKDTDGNWKKKMHNVPIVGKMPKFETIQFTSAEMELIEKQKWWAKMVWACFGVTGSELGYTEDAKGMANQIVQSSTFKRKTVYPLLRLEEYKINHEIISEFYESGKNKEIQKAIIKGMDPEQAKKQVGEMEKKKVLPYQGLKFKFMIFDVEEETKKANLYKLQIDAGIRTINEIRKDEGLEELEWGSNDPKEREQGFGNNDFGNPLGQEQGQKEKESKFQSKLEYPGEKKKINSKSLNLKHKYIKRTGSPGNYKYWYRNPQTGKLEEGDKQEEETGKNPYQEGSEAYNAYEEGHRDSTKEEQAEQDKIAQDISEIKKKIDSGEDPEKFIDDLRNLEVNLNQSTADKINYEKIKQEIIEKLNNSTNGAEKERVNISTQENDPKKEEPKKEDFESIEPSEKEEGLKFKIPKKYEEKLNSEDCLGRYNPKVLNNAEIKGIRVKKNMQSGTMGLYSPKSQILYVGDESDFYDTLHHEIGHAFDGKEHKYSTSEDWLKISGWKRDGEYFDPVDSDESAPSIYGREAPWEDYAETFEKYVTNTDSLKENYPIRYTFMQKNFPDLMKLQKEIKALIEGKPGMGHSDKWWEIYHALIREGHSKESAAKIANSKEEKALNTNDNPLILRENERLDSKRLEVAMVYLLKQNEKMIQELIEREVGQNKLMEIKSLDDIVKAIKKLLTFEGLKAISDAIIKRVFVVGWEDAEKQTNMNLLMNKDALSYLQNYTFENIKNMTDEIANDLRAELQRGIMEGEGIAKIKDRVRKVFNVNETRAEAIARTETNRAENQGKLQAFKSSGKDFIKEWNAHMDDRTSQICRRLNGQRVKMNENFKDKETGWEGPCPSAHVNCRSSVLYLREGE